ncbi:MAG TPA: DUF1501 domain-containing protein, partial [Planctomycetia bacterium]|nr:DUF1501 domain-containing protein [Planctomycetia bacterium]
MNPVDDLLQTRTRRQFLGNAGLGFGALALADLANAEAPLDLAAKPGAKAKAKRVIYLHMSGAPPQLDMYDPKPLLNKHHLQPCPESVLKGERFAFIKGRPKLLGSPYKFARHGKSGAWLSELLPGMASHADEMCFVKSMWTDQFNHAPAELFVFTGSPRFDGAAMGSWITWGLGSENKDLPGFVVLVSGGTDPTGGKALWSSGFLPSVFQGVQCRTAGDPILYLRDPPGMSRESRRASLDAIAALNESEWKEFGDPETRTRMSQYELAFRMQISAPEIADLSREPEKIRQMYGSVPGQASFANNCLLARRLVEKGVRYVQLFDWGWDTHGTNPGDDIVTQLPRKCKETDKAVAALLTDLKQRGLLDDTLVVWGGEFGRTPMNEARGGSPYLGRDHHPHCFTIWMAGGGVKPGMTYGATDELGYRPESDAVKVGVHDLQATILHLLGLDPFKLAYK